VVSGAQLHPKEYKILTEVLGKGKWNSVVEIPFTFTDRENGESKLTFCIITDYVKQISNIAKYSLVFRNNHVWNEWEKMGKFCFVGLSGVLVNVGFLYLFTEYIGVLSRNYFALIMSVVVPYLL